MYFMPKKKKNVWLIRCASYTTGYQTGGEDAACSNMLLYQSIILKDPTEMGAL